MLVLFLLCMKFSETDEFLGESEKWRTGSQGGSQATQSQNENLWEVLSHVSKTGFCCLMQGSQEKSREK